MTPPPHSDPELVVGEPGANDLRRLAAHLERVREEERKMLARSLHDDVAQPMTALGLSADVIEQLVEESPEAVERLGEMREILRGVIQTIRDRIDELLPSQLDDFGLAAAARGQAADFEDRTGVICRVDIDGRVDDCAPDRRIAVFRTLQGALLRAQRLSGVSAVRVGLQRKRDRLTLEVFHDGWRPSGEVRALEELDFLVVRERARVLGGECRIASETSDGATMTFSVPAHGS